MKKYFDQLGLLFHQVTARHIEDFYQSIFDDGCNANTVIHYHSILNKSFKYAMKKRILKSNPMEEVERPKKNQYRATFCSVEEMMVLMDAFSEDPLALPVQIAAYYGLRRSEVLGLKWDAIDFKNNTISIRHKVIEVEVDGKFIPVGEDVLKTKSSFRTLPLIPEVKNLLLQEKEKQAMYRRLFRKSYYLDYYIGTYARYLHRTNTPATENALTIAAEITPWPILVMSIAEVFANPQFTSRAYSHYLKEEHYMTFANLFFRYSLCGALIGI